MLSLFSIRNNHGGTEVKSVTEHPPITIKTNVAISTFSQAAQESNTTGFCESASTEQSSIAKMQSSEHGQQRSTLLWPLKPGRSRLFMGHEKNCECCLKPLPMQQSLDEIEWICSYMGTRSDVKI